MGLISQLTIAFLNLNPISVWIAKAKSKTLLPVGNSITSPLGVYKKIRLSNTSIFSSFLNHSLSSEVL